MNDGFILSLIEKFSEGSIASLELQQGDDYIVLRKKEALLPAQGAEPQAQAAPAVAVSAQAAAPAVQATQLPQVAESAQSADVPAQDADLVQIKSPIVGTFYRAPSPDSPVYVEVGSAVKKGEPLCILEAIKMMNTLESEFDCIIEKILVENGDLVEYDEPLFLVRKSL